jgi:hypothetical protein
LPPCDVLDAILQRHVEGLQSADEIVQAGFDRQTVDRVLAMVRGAESSASRLRPD